MGSYSLPRPALLVLSRPGIWRAVFFALVSSVSFSSNRQTLTTSTRFSFWTWLPVHCKTRQHAWHVGCWLGFPYILGCRRFPTGGPRTVRYVGRLRRDGWFDPWEKDHPHGTASDGCWLVHSLELHGQRSDFVVCLYSPALRCRSCCCPHLYRKRIGGCWSCINAPRTGPTGILAHQQFVDL